MKFVQAKNFTVSSSARRVDLVVLHSMESQEKPDVAEAVAAWFGGANAPRASAHFCVDAYTLVQCVRLQDVAWAAPGANHNGVQIEISGKAAQSPVEWGDLYSSLAVDLAARLAAEICLIYQIPPKFVGPSGLLAGARGITTHVAATEAFKKSTHTDPGVGFPMEKFLRITAMYMTQSVSKLL